MPVVREVENPFSFHSRSAFGGPNPFRLLALKAQEEHRRKMWAACCKSGR